jgi:hypothetical protein
MRLRYGLGPFRLLWGVLFFGISGLALAYASATNRRGLIIDGIIRLSPDGASTFYLVACALCFAFVGYIIFYVLPQMFISRTIILIRDSITLPGPGLDKAHYRLTPAEIVSAKVTVFRRQRFLKIYTAERNYSINPMWLDDPNDVGEILRWLHTCTPGRVL